MQTTTGQLWTKLRSLLEQLPRNLLLPLLQKGPHKRLLPKVESTAVFRALNPELFIKPNVVVMTIGVVSVSLCVGYIAYLNATSDSRNKKHYMALQEDGKLQKREKVSKWE